MNESFNLGCSSSAKASHTPSVQPRRSLPSALFAMKYIVAAQYPGTLTSQPCQLCTLILGLADREPHSLRISYGRQPSSTMKFNAAERPSELNLVARHHFINPTPRLDATTMAFARALGSNVHSRRTYACMCSSNINYVLYILPRLRAIPATSCTLSATDTTTMDPQVSCHCISHPPLHMPRRCQMQR